MLISNLFKFKTRSDIELDLYKLVNNPIYHKISLDDYAEMNISKKYFNKIYNYYYNI